MLNDKELIREFVIESMEHLADVENQLLAIEAEGGGGDGELVNRVFRAVHSIKGAAGFLGLSTLGTLAHKMENVLNRVRNRELIPEKALTDVLLQAADRLRSMLDSIEQSNEADISSHLTALEPFMSDSPRADASRPSVASSPACTPAPKENIQQTAAPAPPPVPATPAGHSGSTVLSSAVPAPSIAPAAEHSPPSAGGAIPADTNIRVAVTVLDRLMNLAGELVLSRNQLLQMVNAKESRNMDSVAARVNQVTSELQETVMQTRMQEIGTVFNKFPRVVRDLSASLGKQCELRLEGTDVELDKSIIEAIGDPLTHLVRNAVDHGIEPPEQREQAGKPAKGIIVLRAFHQAGKVNIALSDNGRGIDAKKLREKAIAQGLISAAQARDISDREALRLIFRPGFSMAEKVTDVSGRGVGMDVVKTNIERLGGTVGVDTELGQGSTIHIKLPLTLAIIPSLIVRCRSRHYAIPQASISELVRIKAGDFDAKIERIKQAEVFRLRGKLLPLVRLDAALDLQTPQDQRENAAVHIIVVETGQLQYGLVVDEVHDSEEIVVKPLGRHMKDCHCLAGATILGDGKVALILDITGIVTHAGLVLPEEEDLNLRQDVVVASDDESQLMLLFTYAPHEQFCVPMQVIARLERVRSDQIDSVGGQDILQYRGGSLPLLSLDHYIKAATRPETNVVYVVVFNVVGREVGLLVPKVIDIRPIPTNVDTMTLSEPGVIGSLIIDNKATRLLDLFRLTEIARPAWFQERKAPAKRSGAASPSQRPKILLAEDSDFFRKQITSFLQTEGYDVTPCEDGQIAWDTLQNPDAHYDAVVTDIVMPNVNGFQLTRKIKGDPSLARLPVIAITSLAGEEDIHEGKAAGIDDYQIKLDRDQLLASVARQLSTTGMNGPACREPVAAGMEN
jgi:two-component system, chemotaxis family, sensor kinase CheA